jgi:hypothetical protein
MRPIHSFAALSAGVLFSLAATAQPETSASASSNGSTKSIPGSDQLFRKSIWQMLDLREKQNQPMFSEGREVSRVLIEAVKRGELQAYRNDSLTATFTIKQVAANMSFSEGGDERSQAEIDADIDPADSDDWERQAHRQPRLDSRGRPMRDRSGQLLYETVAASRAVRPKATSYEYRYKDLYQLELKEALVFDKKKSRMVHDIQTLTLFVPSTASGNASGIEKPVATFKYADVVRVFRQHPEVAVWFNAQNDAQHKNLADAFELGLFHSYITKISNPRNERLADTFGSEQQGILAAQQTAADLVEYEYNLWSF